MFHIVFVEPRIPPNTGNAIRLAAATGAHLHLVEPLGFDLADAKLRRAGLDYHDLATVTVHADARRPVVGGAAGAGVAFTAARADVLHRHRVRDGDVLMFGPEPTGLSAEVLADPHVTDRCASRCWPDAAR